MLEALAGVVAVVDPDLARPWLLRLLNISSYWMLPWVALGLAGQTLFFLRMAVQWIASERQRASVVPTIYWWFSLAGGLMLLSYFIWRKDAVGVLGQSTGPIVYARNLWLIRRS
jgi:lipid-A-disaccharide synthase-like uncharacterized protein